MARLITSIENYRNVIKYWWVTLLLGVVVFILGIVVFMHPGESYAALSIVFGLLILLSGIAQIFIAVDQPRVKGWGWLLSIGIIEVVIGIILTFNMILSAAVLPLFLGFWLLFRGLVVIGLASDMRHSGIKGTGWTIFWGILLMLCAFLVLIYPAVGAGAIVIWVGLSFLIAGISMAFFAFHLLNLRKELEIK